MLDTLVAAGAAAFYACHPSNGGDIDVQMDTIARGWDEARYAIQSDADQVTALHLLEVQVVVLVHACPTDARPRVWLGVILAGEADASDWLSALNFANEARETLQSAEHLPQDNETRSILESALGALYTQAPPFPISFGDTHRAQAHLTSALAVAPSGIEPNFYEGELLFREHAYANAERYLSAAIAAPVRPNRIVGDTGMRNDARARLREIDKLSPPAHTWSTH